jgi:adenylate kinase family enzyme
MNKKLKEELSMFKFIGGFDINQHLLDLARYIERCEDDVETYKKRLQEYNKDEEIQKLEKRIENLNKYNIG